MTTNQIPTTQNEAWGFWGTMNEHASAAWPLAMNAISDATHQPLESVRTFLDSRHGRHFADDVQNGLYQGQALQDAINAATQTFAPQVPPDQQAILDTLQNHALRGRADRCRCYCWGGCC